MDHLKTLQFAYDKKIPIEFVDSRVGRSNVGNLGSPEENRTRMDLSDAPMAKAIDQFSKRVQGPVFVMTGANHASTWDIPGYLPNSISIDTTATPFDPKSAAKPGRVYLAPERLAPYSDFRDNMNPTIWVQLH